MLTVGKTFEKCLGLTVHLHKLFGASVYRIIHTFGSWCRNAYIRAVSLIESSQTDSENLELLRQLLSYSAVNRHLELLDWSENVAELGREEKKLFFNNAIRVLRECYMINMNMGEIVYTSGEELELCRKIAPYIHSENFLAILNQFESARAQIAQNGNPKIILSHFALQLSKLVYKK